MLFLQTIFVLDLTPNANDRSLLLRLPLWLVLGSTLRVAAVRWACYARQDVMILAPRYQIALSMRRTRCLAQRVHTQGVHNTMELSSPPHTAVDSSVADVSDRLDERPLLSSNLLGSR